ncbi:hypothetical protein BDV98DRAFT_652353 [Pterulicium gracile]|uniref:Mnn4-regulates the mannosylphosphorylation n=1 Tax=Pterulicium gracile TaxID=1884261 RepID=A0A5C3QZ90_9AGAR|nr:hypothetical protein BDV98DRAFT_652353 [Pterula gracilis]
MIPILRGSSTLTTLLRHRALATSRLAPTPSLSILSKLHPRTVASSVSGKPGSQTLSHAATNIKEEAGNSAADLAKMIASSSAIEENLSAKSFASITKSIAKEVPKPYITLGLAGGLPYLGASITTVYLAKQAGLAATGIGMDPGYAATLLNEALNFQVTYGAVMLSFLGAMHWGMEFAGYGGHKGYPRLLLGAAPLFIAWPTLGLLSPTSALIAQWVGFTGLWYADSKLTMKGWAPKWYSQYRFYLSILVGTCIIGSLAGTSYWGPVAGHGLLNHDLEALRDMRREHRPERQGKIKGPVSAVPTGEDGDFYVAIKKTKTEEKKQGEKKESEDSKSEGDEGK